MSFGRFRKSRWFWPITVAVLAHLTLAVFLVYQKLEVGARPGPKSKLVDLSAASQNADGTGEIEPAELDRQLDAGLAKAQSMTDRQRQAISRERADWLEKHSSVQSVEAMSRVVQQSVGAPQRAYEPVEPAPPGTFDFDSMLPYASKKMTLDDGIERSVQTWVDKDGRVLRQTIRRARDEQGVTREYRGTIGTDGDFFETEVPVADDGGLNSVVEMMSRSEILQKVFSGAVLPALESQREKAAQKPAETSDGTSPTP